MEAAGRRLNWGRVEHRHDEPVGKRERKESEGAEGKILKSPLFVLSLL